MCELRAAGGLAAANLVVGAHPSDLGAALDAVLELGDIKRNGTHATRRRGAMRLEEVGAKRAGPGAADRRHDLKERVTRHRVALAKAIVLDPPLVGRGVVSPGKVVEIANDRSNGLAPNLVVCPPDPESGTRHQRFHVARKIVRHKFREDLIGFASADGVTDCQARFWPNCGVPSTDDDRYLESATNDLAELFGHVLVSACP